MNKSGNGTEYIAAPRDEPETTSYSYHSNRDVSCGSAVSFGDRRGSQSSFHPGSRLSCRSSVRDELHTIDESVRKLRVVRYMQEERERAARSILIREEHEDWMNFRMLERAERVKYMNDDEKAEFLRLEALEVERERITAENAAREAAEAAMRRRSSAGKRRASAAVENTRREVESAPTAPPSRPAVNRTPVSQESEDFRKKAQELQRREEELLSRLHRLEDDVSVMRAEVSSAKDMQRAAEESLLREVKRANDEASMRKQAESRAESLQRGLEEMRKNLDVMTGEMERMKQEEKKNKLMTRELEKQLKSLREQLKTSQEARKDLETKYKQLLVEKNALGKARNNGQIPPLGLTGRPGKRAFQQQDSQLNASSGKSNQNSRRFSSISDVKPAADSKSDVDSLRAELERQASAVKAVNDENEALKNQLQDELRMRKKFEHLATQAHLTKSDAFLRAQLEKAESEATQYKAEAAAARKELDEVRVSNDEEIDSLKAWCARVDAQCQRQMNELREQMSRDDMYTPRTARRNGPGNGASPTKTVGKPSAASDSVKTIEKLQNELNETRKQLQESEKEKERAIELAKSLQKEKAHPLTYSSNENSDAWNEIDPSSSDRKERQDAVAERAALRSELAAEQKKVEALQRERDSLLKKRGPTEAKSIEIQTEHDQKVGSALPFSGGGNENPKGLEEIYDKIASLQHELEVEKQARRDAEKEATAQKERAKKLEIHTGGGGVSGRQASEKKKATCGC